MGSERRIDALTAYGAAIRKVAEERGLYFAPLGVTVWVEVMNAGRANPPYKLSDNGVHLTERGYKQTAAAFLGSLRLDDAVGDNPEKYDPLRQAIVAKNQLFFYRWRPQNETYLFGFRKHEQGKNAKEVAEFDPLVSKAEEEIETIRKTLTK